MKNRILLSYSIIIILGFIYKIAHAMEDNVSSLQQRNIPCKTLEVLRGQYDKTDFETTNPGLVSNLIIQKKNPPIKWLKCDPMQKLPNKKVKGYKKKERQGTYACYKCVPCIELPSKKGYHVHYHKYHRKEMSHSCRKCTPNIVFPTRKEYSAHYKEKHYNSSHKLKKIKINGTMSFEILKFSSQPREQLSLSQTREKPQEDVLSKEEIEQVLGPVILIPADIINMLSNELS